MKKIFQLTSPHKTPERQLDVIRHEIKKYISRERKKNIPEEFDIWDFDCAIGPSETEKTAIQLHEINQHIDRLASECTESFYIEIISRAAMKPTPGKQKN